MTDEIIIQQIRKAVEQSKVRFKEARARRDNTAMHTLGQAEFLSGAMLLCNYLTRMDGEVTSQQLERCLAVVGKEMGFQMGPAS